jgi:hypothetical protein
MKLQGPREGLGGRAYSSGILRPERRDQMQDVQSTSLENIFSRLVLPSRTGRTKKRDVAVAVVFLPALGRNCPPVSRLIRLERGELCSIILITLHNHGYRRSKMAGGVPAREASQVKPALL